MPALLRPAIVLVLLFTLATGLAYPLAIAGIAAVVFPGNAGGSLVLAGGRVIGSELIGQAFGEPKYFWPRPSNALDAEKKPYAADASAGSNLGPTSAALHERIGADVAKLREGRSDAVPVGLATASGSGLDPHIAPADALFQVPRVAAARKLPEDRVRGLVERVTEGRDLGVLGERRVNVLRLNMALDALAGG